TGTAMSTDTIFDIASMTKPVTSVATMMLCEKGALTLDGRAGELLPWPGSREVITSFDEEDTAPTTRPVARGVTIRHLLTHTSGLGYDFTSHWVHRMELA